MNLLKFSTVFMIASQAFGSPDMDSLKFPDTTVTTVDVLTRTEPYDAMVFHAGHLWSGSSRLDSLSSFGIRLYDQKDQLIAEMPLPHSVTQLSVYGKNSVIAIGVVPAGQSQSGAVTAYSIIQLNGRTLSKKTVKVAPNAWATSWMGTMNQREYFTDPGGDTNDDNGPINLPKLTIFSVANQRVSFLPSRLQSPLGGLTWNGKLVIRQAIGGLDSLYTNIIYIDPITGKMKRVFDTNRLGLRDMIRLGSSDYAAMLEVGSAQLHVFEPSQGRIISSPSTDQGSRSLQAFGSCLITGSFVNREVQVFKKLQDHSLTRIMTVPVNLTEREFKLLYQIAVDPTSARIYGRSNYACNTAAETCDTDSNRIVALDGSYQQELLNTCRD